jgi:hypothetical protein
LPPLRDLHTGGDGPVILFTGPPEPGDHEGRSRLDRLVAGRHFDAVLVVALMALALVLHGRSLWASYWGDEAIAVGIASHPLASLPHYLVDDGSPPL